MNTRQRQKLLVAAYWRQDCRCIWCGEQTWCSRVMSKDDARNLFGVPPHTPGSGKFLRHRRATAEHILPKINGGKGGANIVMACARCNHTRSADSTKYEPHPEVLEMLTPRQRERIRREFA